MAPVHGARPPRVPASHPDPSPQVDGQVGGYTTSLGFPGAGQPALHFATVRNAGHMVPYTQKSRALHLFSNFINGKPL